VHRGVGKILSIAPKDKVASSADVPSSPSDAVKRLFDLMLALMAAVLLAIPAMLIALLVKVTSPGPVLHWSKRVGRDNCIFWMPKFRTMRISTPQLATHLLANAETYLTPAGSFLRKSSLDELPQILSILRGHLSFVGPRPALFNQDDLIELRTSRGVHQLLPGLTGWAQINGRDELSIPAKVEFDSDYLRRRSFFFDCKIILITILHAVTGRGVQH
jgi:O-antigen biosynthesis protein WbqP